MLFQVLNDGLVDNTFNLRNRDQNEDDEDEIQIELVQNQPIVT